jgi:MoaA/NifB/PqqE/SkfB family radical SAM enzyme
MRTTPPSFLFLQTNQRCNLRCTHCNYWQNTDADKAQYLTLERRRELVQEFAELGGKNVVTCGGEPMLDFEEYFDLMGAARSSGVGCLSVINGTRVQTQAAAERMIAEGPSEITVSLDHWQPWQNDRLRGKTGAHRLAVRALDLLLTARARARAKTPIYVMTILSDDTWPTLDMFYRFALVGLGVDKLKLNIIQPTFQQSGADEYFKGARVSDVEQCMSMIRECDRRWNIQRNPAWLAAVEMYLRSAASCASPLLGWQNRGTEEAICNSYERNVMIDLYGRARLCFSHSFPSAKLERRGDLTRFWNDDSLPIREQMIGCKQFCGISHSVRKEPSLLRLTK